MWHYQIRHQGIFLCPLQVESEYFYLVLIKMVYIKDKNKYLHSLIRVIIFFNALQIFKFIMLTPESCSLFELPFFQFSQMKKYCPDMIPQIKVDYKRHWEIWKKLNIAVYQQLGAPFAEPHIEKWCNGWQVRAHFFAYYKYEFYQDSAAILSVILNRRRLSVSLDWHSYRADRSSISLSQYNQWLSLLEMKKYGEFDIWRGSESEYADFTKVSEYSRNLLRLNDENDFLCIGKNLEKDMLNTCDAVQFISQTIRELEPLYKACHI